MVVTHGLKLSGCFNEVYDVVEFCHLELEPSGCNSDRYTDATVYTV